MANSKKALKVLLTGGGSTGHISPLLAIAEGIKRKVPEAVFIFAGVKQGMEARVIPRTGYKLYFAPSKGMPGIRSIQFLFWCMTLFLGVLKALGILLKEHPAIIVASGGFASAPSVFAAAVARIITLGLWRIPVYIHEQNAVPGRMNLAAARIADRIGLSHQSASAWLPKNKSKLVGYPVQASFDSVDREEARHELGLEQDEEYLLVFGGSQGARTINRAIVEALPTLAERSSLRIIHACGTMTGAYNARKDTETLLSGLSAKPSRYELVDYLHNLPVHLAAADLVVIRAGAGSLLEVCAAGKPAIVVPKANLSGDSQVANARELQRKQAIEVLFEEPTVSGHTFIEAVSGQTLAERILFLLEHPDQRRALGEKAKKLYDPNSANRTAEDVLRLIGFKTEEAVEKGEEPGPDSAPATKPFTPTVLRQKLESILGIRWEQAFAHGKITEEEIGRLTAMKKFSEITQKVGVTSFQNLIEAQNGDQTLLESIARMAVEYDIPDVGNLFFHAAQLKVNGVADLHQLVDIADIDYLRYRGAALLVHNSWLLRNEGIKLLGLTKHEGRLDLLVNVLTDRTPDSRLHRLMGGDFQQVGFVRRNAVAALALIGVWNDDVRKAVLAAIDDPYYEVRSWTMKLIRTLRENELDKDAELVEKVKHRTGDKKLEVRSEALHTYGVLGSPVDVLEVTKPLLLDFRPMLRDSILRGWEELLVRFPEDQDAEWRLLLQAEMDSMLITSITFRPHFPLKEKYGRLNAFLHSGEAQ